VSVAVAATVWRQAHGLCSGGSDTAADRRAPHGLSIIQIFLKLAQTCKFKMDAFHCLKISQVLQEATLEYFEQLSQLC
jgi:hypothetical protein